tara:strand:- start:251 stop:472 length:222 start_codon:yes stop_codon:yes gene_type:complete
MLGRACMLLLLPAAAHGQVEHVRQITNGTGLYCRGCAVLVEAVHEQLMATRYADMMCRGLPGYACQPPACGTN